MILQIKYNIVYKDISTEEDTPEYLSINQKILLQHLSILFYPSVKHFYRYRKGFNPTNLKHELKSKSISIMKITIGNLRDMCNPLLHNKQSEKK